MNETNHITSEIGKLKTVLLHRPGEELENLTPDYLNWFFISTIFTILGSGADKHNALRKHIVVESSFVSDQLVVEIISKKDQLREQFVDETLAASKQDSRRVTQTLRWILLSLPTMPVIRKITGARKDEITLPPDQHQQLHNMIEAPYPFHSDPDTNLPYTTSCRNW